MRDARNNFSRSGRLWRAITPVRVQPCVVSEDISSQEILDNLGRKQTVNCVNESGFYALIFGSKLESAKRFKKWVTSEVLPAIRRTGRYECPVAATLTIDAAQQLAIRNAVARRAKNVAVHYQTIYRALYARFQIPRYTELLCSDFDNAMRFIANCEIRPQIEATHLLPEGSVVLTPQLPEGSVVLTPQEAEQLLTLIYDVCYLFRDAFEAVYKMMRIAQSPISGHMYDAFHEIPWGRWLDMLARHGHDIRDLPCFQHWLKWRTASVISISLGVTT